MRILPVIVTTMQGMETCLDGHAGAIYIDRALYCAQGVAIRKTMIEQGYLRRNGWSKKGALYISSEDLRHCEIYDPCGIL